MTTARLIRQHRRAADLTQAQLAAVLGCSPQKISHMERGYTAINAAELPRIARALGVQPAALVPAISLDGVG